MIVAEVEQTRKRSGWTTSRTLRALGVPRATYYRQRRALEEDRGTVPRPVAVHRVTPEERAAVVAFKLKHPELRHRPLAWTMIDEDVAYLSPSSVYRILSEEGLLEPWERSKRGTGKKPRRPNRPSELWQTDLRYVKVAGRQYFLLVFLDVFSRFVPYWELLRSMDGETVSLAALTALETLAEEDREGVTIQSDNGSAFVSADFARVLKENGVGHARIHPHTPEQNAFVERVLRTLGEPWYEDEFASFQQAEGAMAEIVEWYNHHRLHSGIGYVTPAAMHFGEAERIHEERRAKLAQARHRRKEENLKLRQRSLALAAHPETWEPQTTLTPEMSQSV
jgi:putative transposase